MSILCMIRAVSHPDQRIDSADVPKKWFRPTMLRVDSTYMYNQGCFDTLQALLYELLHKQPSWCCINID